MAAPVLDSGAVTGDEQAVPAIQALQRMLEAGGLQPSRLVTPDGRTLTLPEPVDRALRAVIAVLAAGDGVAIAPLQQQFTTNQAARLLHVSRPYLIKLLERGEIPYSRTGSHRRVRLADVLAYKERHDRDCTARLDAILAEAQ